jgi:hypothetical protein
MSRLGKDNVQRHGDPGAKTFRPAKLENPAIAKRAPAAPVHASPKATFGRDAGGRLSEKDRTGGRIGFDDGPEAA